MRRRQLLLSSAGLAMVPAMAGAAGRLDFRWIDERLQERVKLGYFDGIGMMIGRGPRVLQSAHVGHAHAHRVLHVACTGKWVAVAVVAAVVDTDALDWDDPVVRFLLQFKGPMGQARLRQLLSHTAGYPDYQPEGRRRDDYPTLTEAVEHIQDSPPVRMAWELTRTHHHRRSGSFELCARRRTAHPP